MEAAGLERTGTCTSKRLANHGVKGPCQKTPYGSPAASMSVCFAIHATSVSRFFSKLPRE